MLLLLPHTSPLSTWQPERPWQKASWIVLFCLEASRCSSPSELKPRPCPWSSPMGCAWTTGSSPPAPAAAQSGLSCAPSAELSLPRHLHPLYSIWSPLKYQLTREAAPARCVSVIPQLLHLHPIFLPDICYQLSLYSDFLFWFLSISLGTGVLFS